MLWCFLKVIGKETKDRDVDDLGKYNILRTYQMGPLKIQGRLGFEWCLNAITTRWIPQIAELIHSMYNSTNKAS